MPFCTRILGVKRQKKVILHRSSVCFLGTDIPSHPSIPESLLNYPVLVDLALQELIVLKKLYEVEKRLSKLVKETSESIKGLLASISYIIAQQAAEDRLQKKVKKLDRKLQKEKTSLEEMENKLEWNDGGGDTPASPSNPSSIKRAKVEAFLSAKRDNIEALKKLVESEEENYSKVVQLNKFMTLNSLRSRLPHLFQSLASFASAYVQAVDVGNSQDKQCNGTTSEN